uniref:Transposase n=1 Tax=Rhodococcus sp. CIR2 TaxID=90325 RepID=Q9WXF7_9NOCA|nr:transposase [Rhodococcus sp. CIR2]
MQEPTARPVGPYASGPPPAALTVHSASLDHFRAARLWRALVIGVVVVAYTLFALVTWPVRRRGRTLADAASEGLVNGFEVLGPTFVKVGQLMASSSGVFPAPLANACLRCLDDVPPVPAEEARRVIEADLGHPVDALFASFDDVPLAAASVAQVHGCVLPDGREAVIKVQRPDIFRRMVVDLRTAYWGARIPTLIRLDQRQQRRHQLRIQRVRTLAAPTRTADPTRRRRLLAGLQLEHAPANRGLADTDRPGHRPHPAMPQRPGLRRQRQTPLPLVQMRQQDLEPLPQPPVDLAHNRPTAPTRLKPQNTMLLPYSHSAFGSVATRPRAGWRRSPTRGRRARRRSPTAPRTNRGRPATGRTPTTRHHPRWRSRPGPGSLGSPRRSRRPRRARARSPPGAGPPGSATRWLSRRNPNWRRR